MLAKLKSLFGRRGGTVEERPPLSPLRHRPSTNVIMPSARAAEIASQSRNRTPVPRSQPVAAPSRVAYSVPAPKIDLHMPAVAETPTQASPAEAAESQAQTGGEAVSNGMIAIAFHKILQKFPQELSDLAAVSRLRVFAAL